MRIDAYTHFIPEKYFNKIVESGHADIGKRVREIPCIHDLDIRRKIVDGFKDYAQILSYPMPPLEVMTKGDGKLTEEYTRLVNDGFAEICRKYPDQFPGWVGQAALIAPDGGVREAERAIKNGALGLQIYTNIAGKPLDDPAFEPFFEVMNKSGKPVWMHPARAANFPDYLTEKKSKYEIWWTFGWSYETAAAMARLVFSGIMDKYPNLKIITHHFGGIVPMLEGRIGPGWDQLGARTSDEDSEPGSQAPEEAAARLLQAHVLCRHSRLRRRAGDTCRSCVLRSRQDRVCVRLPLRSRKGNHVHARNPAHYRGH